MTVPQRAEQACSVVDARHVLPSKVDGTYGFHSESPITMLAWPVWARKHANQPRQRPMDRGPSRLEPGANLQISSASPAGVRPFQSFPPSDQFTTSRAIPFFEPRFLSTTLPGAIGYFSGGHAAGVLDRDRDHRAGILIGSHVYVSHPEQVARQSAFSPLLSTPLPSMVGRITGMVDCKWEKKGLGIRDWGLERVRVGGRGLKISPNP